MNGARVATVGDNTIDRYHGGPVLIGGNALNVAVQLRRLGVPATYFGAVGADSLGGLIADALRRNDVDVSGLVIADGATAITEIRLTADGDRVFEREDFGVTAAYDPTDDEVRRIAEHDWVHIGMLPRADAFVARLRSSNPRIRISQDCAVSPGYAQLNVAFCSADQDQPDAEARAAEALAAGAGLAVVTRGAAGSIACDGNSEWRCDADPVEVVDTTGAGDSFIAGFIAARLDGAQVPAALASGAHAAARTCSHVGGFPQ